jgi:N-acetylglucosamine-6-sulfatase
MDPKYDEFFASFPRIAFKECMLYQDVENEEPFYPPSSRKLQTQFRLPTDNFVSPTDNNFAAPSNDKRQGSWEQRHDSLKTILQKARKLTDKELGI